MSLLSQLNLIFRQVFDDNSIDIRPEMTANDIEGWDSLSHVNLITAVEARFNIRFTRKELLTFKNIGHLLEATENKVVAVGT